MKPYYITTPIYYVNGLPHVGSALTTIACDALARYHRLRGQETFLLTGTDENATKVQEAAEKAGVPPQEFVDGLANAFRECWQKLHVNYNDFIRTTEPRHVRAVQAFFARLLERGYVYKDIYEGWYSVSDETFLRDSDVIIADEERGIARETGKPVQRIKEENYFFKLSAFGDRLLAHIEANPAFLLPEFRRNEVLGFIKDGLRDICISRANKGWGIPFPGDDTKIIYVWFDALINYLTALGWPDITANEAQDTGEEGIGDAIQNLYGLWPADVHFMGKEIFVRFHATLWPAMLMALDLPLPRQVYAHGWWTLPPEKFNLKPGEKAGKSTGGLPHPTRFSELLAERAGTSFELGADAQRYLLCREMNFGLDTEFTVENCLRRFNTDLANDLGNLLNRTINMMVKYYENVVPVTTDHDHEIAALSLQVQEEYTRALAEFRLNIALEAVWKLVGRMNKYIDERAPWSLARAANGGDEASREQLAVVLYSCLEVTRIVSLLVSPFMPVAADAIRAQLGLTDSAQNAHWDDLAWGGLPVGTRVASPKPIFPRLQDLTVDEATHERLGSLPSKAVEENKSSSLKEKSSTVSDTTTTDNQQPTTNNSQLTAGVGTPVAPAVASAETPPITIDDFMKVELRVGEVLAAEPVPNATKLLRLTIHLGEDDTRTILAGIAEYYQPDQLVGQKVVVVANLQPRKMRGIESQGMLLAADVDGRAVLLKPDADAPIGSRIR
jgi:methionyl-tRNA synthetase